MYLQTLFNIISLTALAVIGGTFAQDDGPGFVTKCVQPGHVALTFDDGPSPPNTPKLLGYLSAAKVTATFFVLGVSINQDGGKETLKAAFDAGHQIALHSNTHANMNAKTPDEILSEYTINLKAVQDTIGASPTMARPPFGNCNAACAKVLEDQMNLTVIQWSCDSNDWQYEEKPDLQPKLFTNMQAIIDKSNPFTDSFVTLQHDIDGFSVDYVTQIIGMIRGKGYKFVTVEQCIGKAAYVGGTVQSLNATSPSPSTPSPSPSPNSDSAVAPPPAASAASAAAVNVDVNSNTTSAVTPTPTYVNSSANKFTFTFGLNLIGLIFGLLMY